jgi:hypothetical protein
MDAVSAIPLDSSESAPRRHDQDVVGGAGARECRTEPVRERQHPDKHRHDQSNPQRREGG